MEQVPKRDVPPLRGREAPPQRRSNPRLRDDVGDAVGRKEPEKERLHERLPLATLRAVTHEVTKTPGLELFHGRASKRSEAPNRGEIRRNICATARKIYVTFTTLPSSFQSFIAKE